MLLADALQLQPGDRVASPHDNPAYRIRRIRVKPSGVWVNGDRSIVRISLPSYRSGEWVSPEAFVLVPKRATFFDLAVRRWARRSTKKDGAEAPPYIHLGPVIPRDAETPAEV